MLRPGYHYRPEQNWINDPNGLCQVDGWYHLFFQYNPNGSEWGDIHWGHARSKDMLHWETLAPAMSPAYEKGEIHCFSGGCCKDENGRPHFFYTSIGRKEDGRDPLDGAQQWLAEPTDADLSRLAQTDDGALTDAIHGGMHVRDWRDPCVLRWGAQYLMVLGGCVEGRGCVLLYTSPDMKKWTYHSVLAQSAVANGVPWECPNLIPVENKLVLLYSPCAPVEVMVGTLDAELTFHVETTDVLDPAGHQGYYAPQCLTDEAGRPIVLGWMPECDGPGGVRRGWSGVMSLPRLMHIRGGYLSMEALPGVESLAKWETRELTPGRHCLAQDGRRLMLKMPLGQLTESLRLTLFASPDGAEQTILTLKSNGLLTLDRSMSSMNEEANKSSVSRVIRLDEGENELFLALDGSTVECAVNGQWLSGRVYPTGAESAGVYLETSAACTVSVGSVE